MFEIDSNCILSPIVDIYSKMHLESLLIPPGNSASISTMLYIPNESGLHNSIFPWLLLEKAIIGNSSEQKNLITNFVLIMSKLVIAIIYSRFVSCSFPYFVS